MVGVIVGNLFFIGLTVLQVKLQIFYLVEPQNYLFVDVADLKSSNQLSLWRVVGDNDRIGFDELDGKL